MIERITNNFGWKILSIGLAFLLWLIIVNYDDPQITRTFYDVPVQKLNEYSITSEKKAIEYKEGELVTIRVRGIRSVLERMNVSDIIAYADLQKKSITGAIDIQIELPELVSIVDKQPSMMMVELENIITVQKEVQPYMEGEPKAGYIYLDPLVAPNYIEVEGPESKVSLIKSVLVPVNIEGVTRDVTLYGSPKIIDEANNEIIGLMKSIGQVQIQVPIRKLNSINILNTIALKVAEGYELINLTLSQNTLQIRGDVNDVDSVKNVVISNVDISQLTQDTTIKVNVAELLPSGIFIYNDNSEIEVYVDIEPIIEKTIIVTHNDIDVKQLAENMQFSFVDEEVYSITFKGVATRLDKINLEQMAPFISLEGLSPGKQAVSLDFFTPNGVELMTEDIVVDIDLIDTEPLLPGVPSPANNN